MFVFTKTGAIRAFLDHPLYKSRIRGFVPTMGALHSGHLTLIRQCAAAGNLTICSIFVNPTQFNNPEDLEKYPRTIASDLVLLEQAGCDVVFYPGVEELYPGGPVKKTRDFGILSQVLEGKFRPGHFDGVAEVVGRLFAIIDPGQAYFGLKDYQQCLIIEQLVKQDGLKVKLHFEPTVREEDGLAMSSRNRRLSAQERKDAVMIPDTLKWMKANYTTGDIDALRKRAEAMLATRLKPEYLEIVNAQTLQPVKGKDEPALAILAAWCGEVRLIDNMLLND